jgi:hypothetical protein
MDSADYAEINAALRETLKKIRRFFGAAWMERKTLNKSKLRANKRAHAWRSDEKMNERSFSPNAKNEPRRNARRSLRMR